LLFLQKAASCNYTFHFKNSANQVLNKSNVSLLALIAAEHYKSIDKTIPLPVMIRQEVTLPDVHPSFSIKLLAEKVGLTSTSTGVEHYMQN